MARSFMTNLQRIHTDINMLSAHTDTHTLQNPCTLRAVETWFCCFAFEYIHIDGLRSYTCCQNQMSATHNNTRHFSHSDNSTSCCCALVLCTFRFVFICVAKTIESSIVQLDPKIFFYNNFPYKVNLLAKKNRRTTFDKWAH